MLILSLKLCFCLLGFFVAVPNFAPYIGTTLEAGGGWVVVVVELDLLPAAAAVFVIPGILSPRPSHVCVGSSVEHVPTHSPFYLSTGRCPFVQTDSRNPFGLLSAQLCAWGSRAGGACWWQLASGLLSLPFWSYNLRFRNSRTRIAQNMQMGKGLPSLPVTWNEICKVSSFLFMEAFGLYASVRTGMNFKHVSMEHN